MEHNLQGNVSGLDLSIAFIQYGILKKGVFIKSELAFHLSYSTLYRNYKIKIASLNITLIYITRFIYGA